MVRVQIGTYDNDLRDVREDELVKQIKGRRSDGLPVCIRVTIKSGDLNLVLATPDCESSGRGRLPTREEQEILDTWDKMKLNTNEFGPGNLMSFLRQVHSLC